MKLLGYANCFGNVKQRLIKKSGGVLRQNAVKKYAYLERCYGSAQIGRQSCLPIRRACEMLNISVSGFYEWRHCDKAHRFGIVEADDFIVQTLKAIIKNSCGGHIPGVLVCYHYLREQGLGIDLKCLRRLMREHGLFHRFHRKYIQTTDSEHNLVRSPNLLQ